ncbi:hypothetical protein [Mucilaginibacter sp. KACC 22063]|uniref:hypothetical protein n=1 Tax=Mucilaginibacter sp. KACC 22063 TaxID=3025666 RepID=UPI0023673419|nr:hypothetical protein [Mucilaginibacter sp. KACC 22063]WDF56537.1 hypothetical protein PQ461_05670 [Mucilaginibacter sp. KACC 22063]
MKKTALLCSICLCCLSAFAQTSNKTDGLNCDVTATVAQPQTENKVALKLPTYTPYLVGSSTVYNGQAYTYSVDGAAPGSTYSAWSSNQPFVTLISSSGPEATFQISGTGSFTIYVQVNSGGTIYYLSMASTATTCRNCPVNK